MEIAVILPAAGKSNRFAREGVQAPKLEVELAGRPVLLRTAELFIHRPEVAQVIVAADPDRLDDFKFRWGDKLGFLGIEIVPGGRQERWETVLNALAAVKDSITHIAVHDAARPITPDRVIDRVFQAAEQHPAVIPGVPVAATLKRVRPFGDAQAADQEADPLDRILGAKGKSIAEVAGCVTETVPRADLYQIQTPQVFERSLLQRAYQQITAGKLTGAGITDDASLVEILGEPVVVVTGDELNIKITRPGDLDFATAVLAMQQGQGGGDPLDRKRKFPTWAEMDEE